MVWKVILYLVLAISVVDGYWKPTPLTNWTWQLQGKIVTTKNVAMYDIDLFDAPVATITKLKQAGRKVICYFSAGSYEEWRPDASQFTAEVLGDPLDGWPGERWLDITNIDIVGPIMQARLNLAVSKGCDGVEPDNVDTWTQTDGGGFWISYDDQLAYNKWLAEEAHDRGLSIGLKNDLDQIVDLVNDFDWALNEQCWYYNECNYYAPFIAANKAVFNCEYNTALPKCPKAISAKLSSIQAPLALDGTKMKMCNKQGQLVSF